MSATPPEGPPGPPDDLTIRADPDRLVGWYRGALEGAQHRAAVLEIALTEARQTLAERDRQVEELAARVAKLEGEPANVEPSDDGDTYADLEPEEARP